MSDQQAETELDPYRTLYEAWVTVLTAKGVGSIDEIPMSWDEVEEPLRGAFVGGLSELRRQMRAAQSGEATIERDRKMREGLNAERHARRVAEQGLRDARAGQAKLSTAHTAACAELDRMRRNRDKEAAQ